MTDYDDDYSSGPYCSHWDDPESCSDCAKETLLSQSPTERADVAKQILGAMGGAERLRFLVDALKSTLDGIHDAYEEDES